MQLKYGIIGTGAIGGYYGGKLARAGKDVHFLFHRDYGHVCEHGLQVNSCDGSFHLSQVYAYSSTTQMPKCDVVLVALKSVHNQLLDTMLPPLLNPRTVVVLIQNGIGLEDDLQQRFPGLQIVAGLAFICSAKTEPGVVNHQCYGSINIGNYSCTDEERFEQIVADFCQADVEAHVVEYHEARWKKAVWNMPFNGMTVALNTQTNLLLSNPNTRQLIYEQMMEVVRAANHLGVEGLDESFVLHMLEVTDQMVPYSPSMKLDYDFHRPMEIYYLYTRPIEEAMRAGYAMTRLRMLEAELRFLASEQGIE